MIRKTMMALAAVLSAGAAGADGVEPPVALAWGFEGERMFSRKAYLKDVDFLAANTRVDMLAISSYGQVNVFDDDYYADFAALVARAREKGMRVCLHALPGMVGFGNSGLSNSQGTVDGADEGAYVIANQAEAQGIAYEDEVVIDTNGYAKVTVDAKWARNKLRPLWNEIVAAYAFEKTGEGFYRPGSLVDMTAAARPIMRTSRRQVVEIDAGAAFAGKTLYLLTAQYFNTCDLFGGAMTRFHKSLVDRFRDLPLAGVYFDEFGWMFLDYGGVSKGRVPAWRGRFYSKAQAAWWQESRNVDLKRLLLDMRYAPEGQEAVRIRAINGYMDVITRKPAEIEREVYDYQRTIWGDEVFRACHSTFHNKLDVDEPWHTGCDWWEIPRDWGFTDERIGYPVRMGVLLGAKRPFLEHMYYSRRADDYYDQIVGLLPFHGREFHHCYGDDYWGKGFMENDMPFLRNIRKLDDVAKRLNGFQAKSWPRMDTLVVFGMPSLFNWYPDAKARNAWDVDGSLKVLEKANALWERGHRVALIPDRMVEAGRVAVKDGRFVYDGHAFANCIFLYPKYSRRCVYDFLNAAADAKLPIAVVGRADIDFDAKPAAFRGRRYDTWKPEIAEEIGAKPTGIPGGAVDEDGSFTLVSRGILDGKPTKFDFTVDGVRYSGRHTGVLAYRKGDALSFASPGSELSVDGVRVELNK